MQVARPATAGTNRKLTGDMRVGARGEGGDLFVPHVQPLNAAMAAQRIGEAVEAVADNAVDAF